MPLTTARSSEIPAADSRTSGYGRNTNVVVIALLLIIAGVVVATTLRALLGWYLPVPVSDTWEGSFGFTRDAAGDFLGALWRPHNEHRIVLTKLLFWVNNTYLGGGNAILIAINVVLTMAVAAATAWLTAAMLAGYRAAQWMVGIASFISAFAWVHRQNLVWEFQSQFYLAVLFSLLAMTLAGRAHQRADSTPWYLAAVGCALLAMVSMGAGVPAAVALGVVLVALPAPRRVVLGAAAVLVVALGLYQVGLVDASANTDVITFMTEADVPPVVALLTFLGGPIYWATGSFGWAQAGGAVFLLVSVSAMVPVAMDMRRRQARSPMIVAGLGYVLVVLANGVSAALLRSDHGELVLVGSRYQILVLTGWLVLAVAVAATLEESRMRRRATRWAAVIAGALVLLVLPSQLNSGAHPADPAQGLLGNPARRTSAALAVELAVPDTSYQMLTLYYRPDAWPDLSEYVREQQWAIFGGRFRDLRETLGGTDDDLKHVPCRTVVNDVEPLAEDPAWSVVRGRVVAADGDVPELLQFTDPEGVIVGYGTPGFATEEPLGDSGMGTYSGFRGYARTTAAADLRVGCAWR